MQQLKGMLLLQQRAREQLKRVSSTSWSVPFFGWSNRTRWKEAKADAKIQRIQTDEKMRQDGALGTRAARACKDGSENITKQMGAIPM